MKQASIVVAAMPAVLCVSTPAVAGDIPEGGLTPEQVASWLQDAGCKAQIQTDSNGKRNIYSAANGSDFHVSMCDCKRDVCGSLQFWVGFETKGAFTAERINTWNGENRWVRVHVDWVNDPWLEMDVDLTPGGTYENLSDESAIYLNGVKRFRDQNQF